jgi:hypothetical protein
MRLRGRNRGGVSITSAISYENPVNPTLFMEYTLGIGGIPEPVRQMQTRM